LLAFIGTADAGTLYWAHRTGVDLPCTSGDGCDLVNASHWSHFGPFPVALFGLAAYILVLFSSVLKITSDSAKFAERLLLVILAISLCGTGYSWYLQYVAKVFIGAFCIYCRVSAITMTCIFLTSLFEKLSSIYPAPKITIVKS
jgi:uncharacterized membrane protein